MQTRVTSFVMAILTTVSMSATAGQDSTSLGISITIVDPTETPARNFIPQAPKAGAGYTPYPVACNIRHNACIDAQQRPIGTIDLLSQQLPAVDAEAVRAGTVVCDRICYNAQGQIIGSTPLQIVVTTGDVP